MRANATARALEFVVAAKARAPLRSALLGRVSSYPILTYVVKAIHAECALPPVPLSVKCKRNLSAMGNLLSLSLMIPRLISSYLTHLPGSPCAPTHRDDRRRRDSRSRSPRRDRDRGGRDYGRDRDYGRSSRSSRGDSRDRAPARRSRSRDRCVQGVFGRGCVLVFGHSCRLCVSCEPTDR